MMTTKNLLPVLLVPAAILLIPLAAMVFKVEGWAWSLADFVFMWVLMAGVGLAYRLITLQAVNLAYRIGTGMGLLTGFMLIWVNGAVGLIGSEDNPANGMYAGVLLVGAAGALLGRLKPLGMSRALFATASAQFLVPVLALKFWPADFSPGVVPVFILNSFFVLLFLGAGLLFRHAATGPGGSRVPTTA